MSHDDALGPEDALHDVDVRIQLLFEHFWPPDCVSCVLHVMLLFNCELIFC